MPSARQYREVRSGPPSSVLKGLVEKNKRGVFILPHEASSLLWDKAEVWGQVAQAWCLPPLRCVTWGFSVAWPCGQKWGWAEAMGGIPSRQDWHMSTLEAGDVVGVTHSSIWGQKQTGAGVAALRATSAFLLGTREPWRVAWALCL